MRKIAPGQVQQAVPLEVETAPANQSIGGIGAVSPTGVKRRGTKGKSIAKGLSARRINKRVMEQVATGTSLLKAQRDAITEERKAGLTSAPVPTDSNTLSVPLQQKAIIEDNIINFRKVMADDLAPYRTLFMAMETATITRKITLTTYKEVIRNGIAEMEPQYRDIYEEVPDWPTRRECARTILTLCGADPRLMSRIEVNGQTGQVSIHIGELYANIGKADSPQGVLDAYNELKRAEQAGEVNYAFPQKDGSELIGPMRQLLNSTNNK